MIVEKGKGYKIKQGNFTGKMFEVIWVSKNKIIYFKGIQQQQVNGKIISTNSICNLPISFLAPKTLHPLSKLSNLMIIRAAKNGNKKAIQEFIRRFKKVPKITK